MLGASRCSESCFIIWKLMYEMWRKKSTDLSERLSANGRDIEGAAIPDPINTVHTRETTKGRPNRNATMTESFKVQDHGLPNLRVILRIRLVEVENNLCVSRRSEAATQVSTKLPRPPDRSPDRHSPPRIDIGTKHTQKLIHNMPDIRTSVQRRAGLEASSQTSQANFSTVAEAGQHFLQLRARM